MYPINLYRHPQTADGIIGGSTDVDICPRLGRRTQQKMADHIVQTGATTIIHSGLKRTREVAESAHQIRPDLTLVECPQIREICLGILEGRHYEEANRTYLAGQPLNIEHILSNEIDGAEHTDEFAKRVQAGLSEILAMARNETVAVIAHSVTNRVIISAVSQIPLNDNVLHQQHGCRNQIEAHGTDWACTLINCTNHLDN